MIKRLMKKIKFKVEIKLTRGYKSNIDDYQQYLIKHLIQQCDRKARKMREDIGLELNESNIKFYGCYSLKKEGIVQMRPIKEVLRVIDVKEEEKRYAWKKYRYKEDFIDLEARNTFCANKVMTSMIKCAHRYNHYGLRHAMINNNLVEANCPHCNQVKTWDHVIKCCKTKTLRREFIQELVIELVKVKPSDVSIDLIMSFIENILWYLENEEEEEYETNQSLIGMKELFRGYVMVVWEGTDLNSKKYRVLNKIVVKKCVEFYVKCWKYRNEIYYDEEKQKERVKK